ncbi:tRNA modification GTPase [Hyunsoonleella sp. SJ7]|uniref:tRNA modification GTPase n=1 Tax=Hyunsoonleella aquatilis TaxID=2762758 RepID=A0A923HBZ6_9FLAO|nr:tRNA modification GTPase [Hyunsoonleella aquatilis]MBC3758564.1 tRNA modification GTPase [Hyunsoonleella aquatilis]
MKKQFLFFLITILSLNCYSQITFEKGYYINNSNQKINCLIKNIDWKSNPTEFEYKLSENGRLQLANINSVKEFGINNISKYVRNNVNIDRSSKNLSNLSNHKTPIFKEEELFLKVLVEGKASLYQYVDGNLIRYFYDNSSKSNIEQLIFKFYKTSVNKVGKNNRFRQQLWSNLKCPSFKISKVESLNYKKNDLVDFFVEYNNCNNQEYIHFEEKQERDLFNLTIRPRLNSSSLSTQSSLSYIRDIEFENKIGFGIGLEAEVILPFNKNKWSIVIEPTYRTNYKSIKKSIINNVSEGTLIAEVDYSSIEVALGLRHYFFLNNASKIFVNASIIFDSSSDSSIDFTGDTGSAGNISSLEIKSESSLGIGVGYKQNDRYSLEIRYLTNREILRNIGAWSSDYKTLSIILGYSIF